MSGQTKLLAGAVSSVASVIYVVDYYLRKDLDDKYDLFKDVENKPCFVTLNKISDMEEEDNIYEFSHKAIWASKLTLPMGVPTLVNVANEDRPEDAKFPPPEHWAFVARGTRTVRTGTKEAYFVVQFQIDHIIPRDVNVCDRDKKEKPWHVFAMYTPNKEFGARLVGKASDTNVWIKDLANDTKKFVHKKGKLVSPDFKQEEWAEMKQPMNLRELTVCVYKTPCSGKEYHLLENNCQHFAKNLFDMV